MLIEFFFLFLLAVEDSKICLNPLVNQNTLLLHIKTHHRNTAADYLIISSRFAMTTQALYQGLPWRGRPQYGCYR
jgi:hypothetical protein